MGQQETMTVAAEGKEGGALRRIILVLTVAALMAAMALGGAGSAQAKDDAHCTGDGVSFSECAGGSGQRGGGGGGKERTTTNGAITSTGGGSDFRGTGRGGGGRNCTTVGGGTQLPCESGKDAER